MHLMHLIIITSGGISRYNMHFSVTAIASLWKLIVDVDRWWIGPYGPLRPNVSCTKHAILRNGEWETCDILLSGIPWTVTVGFGDSWNTGRRQRVEFVGHLENLRRRRVNRYYLSEVLSLYSQIVSPSHFSCLIFLACRSPAKFPSRIRLPHHHPHPPQAPSMATSTQHGVTSTTLAHCPPS